MNRRSFVGGVSFAVVGSLAGCSNSSPEETKPENESRDDQPTTDPSPDTDQPSRAFNEELLVELYDFGTDLRFQALQHFDDGLSHWDADDYRQAMRRFTAAEEKFDASSAALQRVTTRLEAEGLAGFDTADAAKTHIGHMHSAARNYAQAAVSAADGDSTTAESYRESAESFRTQADNHRFADVSAFRAEVRTSQ